VTLTPTHGARFELTLDAGGDAARYRVEARTPKDSFSAIADLDRAGVRIEWTTPPPKWIADTTLGLLRTLHKNHLDDRQWPSRLHRWREER
jgi:hypothetical protein